MREYPWVAKLVGRYYDEKGKPTAAREELFRILGEDAVCININIVLSQLSLSLSLSLFCFSFFLSFFLFLSFSLSLFLAHLLAPVEVALLLRETHVTARKDFANFYFCFFYFLFRLNDWEGRNE